MATALLDEAAAKGTLDAAAAAEEREIEIALAILYIGQSALRLAHQFVFFRSGCC